MYLFWGPRLDRLACGTITVILLSTYDELNIRLFELLPRNHPHGFYSISRCLLVRIRNLPHLLRL